MQNAKFKSYSLEDKAEAVALIRAYLKMDLKDSNGELSERKKELTQLKKHLQELQNHDDKDKIDNISQVITDLYYSAYNVSSFVAEDNEKGISIQYIKRGNILQTVDNADVNDGKITLNRGSMARHTLIQLCGYAAFLLMLIKENKYPIIPFFVIDHISKPFSDENRKAIGEILNTFLKDVGEDNCQIFMFDDMRAEELGIHALKEELMANDKKTGFNPFL